ncbi:hypothetical protein COLO4_19656 [Corchorus olitorius]|uniref:Knl1 C-terminal RWD domain-containing protein n=1 Tax=Corchorus olitorius TaxID=93759 RepID=A0A1R3J4A4_9ROSI|nr:hypothetical protein COLO4_19656 [Corchorus olitorius]
MASKLPDEPPCNTQETDEETVAFRKKRSRRVSFADREITSVHIYRRDEDNETPPESTPKSDAERGKELLSIFRDLGDRYSDESNGGDDDDAEDDDVLSARRSFLRPIESPSPGGSSTVGSAISNDEDNFFGPVSANFIRPGRLSDSAASDDHHDITMDSTAFSMHFRSIVRSELGDLTTSTGVRLASEEKTPCQVTMPSDPENLMVLTKVKKIKSPSPVPINKYSGGRDSNDMSLVGESLHRYDYGRLSPTLEALLAEGSKELDAIPTSESTSPKLSRHVLAVSHDDENDCMENLGYRNSELCNIINHDTSGKSVCIAQNKLVETIGDSTTTLIDRIIMRDCLPNPNDGAVAEHLDNHPIHALNKLNKGNNISEVMNGTSVLNCELLAVTNEPELRLPESLSSKASPSNTVMGELSESLQGQHANVPTVNLKVQLSSVDLKEGKVDCNGLGTVKSISTLTQDGGTTGIGNDREYSEKSTQMAKITSPSKFTHSGKKLMHHLLKSVDPVDETQAASAFNSSPTFEIGKYKRDIGTADKVVSPVVNRLNQKLLSPAEYQGSLSGNLKLQDQDSNIIIVSREECNLGETFPSSNHLTPTAEKGTHSGSVLVKINSLVDSSISKRVDDRQNNGRDLQNTLETLRNFHDGVALKLPAGSPEKNIMTETEPNQSSDSVIVEQLKVSSAYASPDAHKRSKSGRSPRRSSSKKKQAQSPSKKKQAQSPSLEEPSWSSCQKEVHGDNIPLTVVKDVVSLDCSSTVQMIYDHLQRSTQNPTPIQDIQSSSKRKRTSENVALAYTHHADKFSIQRSPKFHKVEENNAMEHMLEHSSGSDEGNERIDGGRAVMNWTDISLKLSADANQLLTSTFDKLNIKVINMLEDRLVHKQKVNMCELLCSEIKSRLCSTYDKSSNIRCKRVAETRPLLFRIVYEKAKLQLMHVKRERLMKQVELLRTRVQESKMLKFNCVKRPIVSAERDAQLDDNSHSVKFAGNIKGASDKVTTMKYEVESLEKKIKNLTKSFHIHCKLKGEPGSPETIELVNDHLKKKACCRYIRQDMQSWEVDDLRNMNGHHNVLLNYHGFINQSFKLNTSPNSSIIVANKLNDTNISKNFPNMDACSAFAFVFNHESTKKYVGPKSLAQETQRTSSLLRNLLDVVEEVQIARLEIRNLTLTSFRSPSAEQLDLQLAFFDFDSGANVMMTLDMTCLKCGVYPSEILPYDIQTPTAGLRKLQLRPLSDEIKAALGNLRAGYSRIIRLCRCVSQVMQSSGR